MSGNVWEWVNDYVYAYGSGAETDPAGATTDIEGAGRMLRGGSWQNWEPSATVAYRYPGSLGDGYHMGFRIARTSLSP